MSRRVWVFLGLALCSHYRLEEAGTSWTSTDWKDLHLHEAVRSGSCGLAISLDTHQSCSSECSRRCGISSQETSTGVWSKRVGRLESDNTQISNRSLISNSGSGDCLSMQGGSLCVMPIGYQFDFKGQELSHESSYVALTAGNSQVYSGYGNRINLTEFDNDHKTVTYHRTFLMGANELRRLMNPMRLGYASLRINNRLLPTEEGVYAEYLSIGREITEEKAVYDLKYVHNITEMEPWELEYYPVSGYLKNRSNPFRVFDGSHLINSKVKYTLPSPGSRTVEDVDGEQRDYVAGFSRNMQTFHQLVQQFFLRYGQDLDEPKLAVTLSRSYPAYNSESGKNYGKRAGETGTNLDNISFNSTNESDTQSGLDLFTTLSYGGLNVSPQCSERSNCGACTSSGKCSWCDMRGADVNRDFQLWAGWFSASKARHADGSACGIPPIVCVMMGGEPTTQSCMVTWKDEWDTFY